MTLTSLFKAIADAIRAKTGGTAGIKAEDFPSAIAGISSGTDTSDATAAAADVRSPKTFYAGGEKKTGSMADVSVPTPGISYSSSGVVSASVSQGAGYTPGGSKSNSYSLPTVGGQTITPGSVRQTISGGKFLTGDIVVEAVSGGQIASGSKTGSGQNSFSLPVGFFAEGFFIFTDASLVDVATEDRALLFYANTPETTTGLTFWVSSSGRLRTANGDAENFSYTADDSTLDIDLSAAGVTLAAAPYYWVAWRS